jgi:hypothetical protein
MRSHALRRARRVHTRATERCVLKRFANLWEIESGTLDFSKAAYPLAALEREVVGLVVGTTELGPVELPRALFDLVAHLDALATGQ